MENAMLWVVGAIAVAVAVAALVWVLRQRDVTGPDDHHEYGSPAVTEPGTARRSGVIVGGSEPVADATGVDETVPLSRLGGAGWRDGGGSGAETAADGYAGSTGTWAEPESEVVADPGPEHHVRVEAAEPHRAVDPAEDDRRGGHW